MPLELPGPIDTRPLFRPVSRSLVQLLGELPGETWERPTIAGAWVVRDSWHICSIRHCAGFRSIVIG